MPVVASYGSRAGAFLLDVLVVFPVLLVAGIVVQSQTTSQETLQLVLLGVYLLIQLTYPPLMLARQGEHNGQTLGKQWVGQCLVFFVNINPGVLKESK